MATLNKKTIILLAIALSVFAVALYLLKSRDGAVIDKSNCPTPETFVQDFNSWSIEFLDGNPTYGEKEQREGWQKHLEDMGCIESQDIIDNAIDGGSTSDYE